MGKRDFGYALMQSSLARKSDRYACGRLGGY